MQSLESQKQQNNWPQKRIKKSASASRPERPFNAAEAKQVHMAEISSCSVPDS